MKENVKPLNVSLLIKSTRYIFLVSGIFYGIMKLSALRTYEATVKPKREKMYAEEHQRAYEILTTATKREYNILREEMGITDAPPGWENDYL